LPNPVKLENKRPGRAWIVLLEGVWERIPCRLIATTVSRSVPVPISPWPVSPFPAHPWRKGEAVTRKADTSPAHSDLCMM
jgi:hypothetical protein